MDFNSNLSPKALKAYQRIRTLQLLTEKTGFLTKDEQFQTLMSLENGDCLAVAELMHKSMREKAGQGVIGSAKSVGVSNGNPR